MKKEITIQLRCRNFPGRSFETHNHVHLGVQRKEDIVEGTPGDADYKVFNLPVFIQEKTDGTPDFKGDFVHGKLGDRFLYLVWFDMKAGRNVMFRRAKIKLQHLTWEDINPALSGQTSITAEMFLTDKKGGPVCASLKEENIRWLRVPN